MQAPPTTPTEKSDFGTSQTTANLVVEIIELYMPLRFPMPMPHKKTNVRLKKNAHFHSKKTEPQLVPISVLLTLPPQHPQPSPVAQRKTLPQFPPFKE